VLVVEAKKKLNYLGKTLFSFSIKNSMFVYKLLWTIGKICTLIGYQGRSMGRETSNTLFTWLWWWQRWLIHTGQNISQCHQWSFWGRHSTDHRICVEQICYLVELKWCNNSSLIKIIFPCFIKSKSLQVLQGPINTAHW